MHIWEYPNNATEPIFGRTKTGKQSTFLLSESIYKAGFYQGFYQGFSGPESPQNGPRFSPESKQNLSRIIPESSQGKTRRGTPGGGLLEIFGRPHSQLSVKSAGRKARIIARLQTWFKRTGFPRASADLPTLPLLLL